MSRVFITGDSHYKEEYKKIEDLCSAVRLTKNDYVLVLGDHGCAYWGEKGDRPMKKYLESLPPTFILLKGNHDQRPSKKTCVLTHVNNGAVCGDFWIDPKYPDIWYPKIFGCYEILGNHCVMLGGAYSIDKFYRLEQQELGHKNWRWFYDEQMTAKEMVECEKEVLEYQRQNPIDFVFSHTCPLKYEPYDKFTVSVDQTAVDKSMEIWMDGLEEKITYKHWMFGHFHCDRVLYLRSQGQGRCLYYDVVEMIPGQRNG